MPNSCQNTQFLIKKSPILEKNAQFWQTLSKTLKEINQYRLKIAISYQKNYIFAKKKPNSYQNRNNSIKNVQFLPLIFTKSSWILSKIL